MPEPPRRRLRVEVDAGRCIGAETCATRAPGVFRLNAQRIAQVIDPTAADEETILAAAMSCPVDAILVETEEGEPLWPV